MVFFSSFQQSYIWLPLLGLIVGVMASMIGSGGGLFFPITLILLFQVPEHIAVTTSLVASLPICIAGSISHYGKGNIHFRYFFIFGTAGAVGAIVGANIASLISEEQLRMMFGIYALFIASVILFHSMKERSMEKDSFKARGKRSMIDVIGGGGAGFAGGIVSGTFGSSGALPVLAGLVAMNIPFKMVVGTSLIVVLVNTLFALAGHAFAGMIDLTLILMLTAGTVIGSLIGPKLLSMLKPEAFEGVIKLVFASLIIVFGVLLLVS
jgi:uncharacterized protein